MASSSSHIILSEALHGHDGNKAALLDAINEVAIGLGSKQVSKDRQNSLLKTSGVNQVIARDLVSNPGGDIAKGSSDLMSFEDRLLTEARLRAEQQDNRFEHSKTLMNNAFGTAPSEHLSRASRASAQAKEEDLRSVKSEYDYGHKKTFVDVMGNISQTQKLKAMQAEHERASQADKAFGSQGARSSVKASQLKSISYNSHISGKSKASKATRASLRRSQMPDVDEELGGEEEPDIEAMEQSVEDDNVSLPSVKPDDFLACNLCKKDLTLDEKIINARFVNEAISTGRDISLFPICISCNFDVFYKKAPLVVGKKVVPGEMREYVRGEGVKAQQAERAKEKEIRARIISEEMAKLKDQIKVETSSFPSTTNQETHSEQPHRMGKPVDKQNFKKKNPYMAYVNSMFNSGVFANPTADMY